MTEEKLGIDMVKALAKTIIDAIEEGQAALEDGKFQITEIVNFFDDGLAIVKMYNNKETILAQLKDIDAEERKELAEYIKSEYDAPTAKADLVVDKVVDILEKAVEVYEQGVMDLVIKTKDLISLLKDKGE